MDASSSALSDYRLSTRAIWTLTLLAFIVTRIGILPMTLDFRMDEVLYQGWAELIRGGSFPVNDDMYQYPPGAGLLFVALDVPPGTFHRIFTLSAITADFLIFALLLMAVKSRGSSWRGPWTWIIGGLLAGGLLYDRFDVFPALMAVAALLLISRPFLSGLVIGIGAMVKVWPILMLFAFARRNLTSAAVGVVTGVVSVLAVAYLVASHPLDFLAGQAARGLQIEATTAVLVLIAGQLGVLPVSAVDRYGSSEVESVASAAVSWLAVALGVVLIGTIVVQRLRGKLESIPGPDVALAALLVFVAFNRVNSSQFFVWIAAMAAVVVLDRRSRMVIPIVLAFLSMLPVSQYLGSFYWALQAQNVEAVALQSLRGSLLLVSALVAWWYVVSGRVYQVPDNVPKVLT
jgi:hypothetical protein